MKKKRVVDIVAEILHDFLKKENMELVDVEFVKEGPYRYLRVTIDKEDAVTLDDCSLVSQYISSKLDEKDPIEEQYFLEVTSPGVERVLKKESEFKKFRGRDVELSFYKPYNGQKMLVAKLMEWKDGTIIVNDHGNIREIPKDLVSVTKLVFDFKEEE